MRHRQEIAHEAGVGGTMDPRQAWIVLRWTRTLAMRLWQAQENARAIAELLAGYQAVEAVRYPGLPGRPQAELIRHQMAGPGSLISFELKGGIVAGRAPLKPVRFPTLAVSLVGWRA